METREIWINNVREIMHKAQLSLSEAADALGTSKQYLSQLLDPARPLSTRERIMHDLVFLLQTTQSDLFDPNKLKSPLPAIAAMTRKPVPSTIPGNGQDLLRRIKVMDEIRDYGEMAALCEQTGCAVINELSPGERAELNYYWGKALINRQHAESGQEKIRSALRLYQQRQSHQPEVCMPKIIGCYRLLALAAYFRGQFEASIRNNRMVMRKWQDHPAFADRNEVLNSATNMLRAARRGGLYRQMPELETEILEFARRNRFPELIGRLTLERLSDEAEVADVYDLHFSPPPPFHDRESTDLICICQGTILLAKEKWKELSLHIESMTEPANSNIALHLHYWQGRLGIAVGSGEKRFQTALDELLHLKAMGNVSSRIDVHLDALRAFREARAGEKATAIHYWLNAISGAKAMNLTGLALELTGKMMKQLAGSLSGHEVRLLGHLFEKEKADYGKYILGGELPNG